MNAENILQGEWRVLCSEVYTVGGWERYENFDRRNLLWIFKSAQEQIYLDTLEFNGELIERCEGQKDCQTRYIYHPNNALLTIERATYLEDGFCDDYSEEQYSIEQLGDNCQELPLLYFSLQNEDDYPPPYFRYLMQRVAGYTDRCKKSD